jgi:hypothetical protein
MHANTEQPSGQARFHTDDARRELLERVFETQSPDLPAEGDRAIGTPNPTR